jgi:hypothetical protein
VEGDEEGEEEDDHGPNESWGSKSPRMWVRSLAVGTTTPCASSPWARPVEDGERPLDVDRRLCWWCWRSEGERARFVDDDIDRAQFLSVVFVLSRMRDTLPSTTTERRADCAFVE